MLSRAEVTVLIVFLFCWVSGIRQAVGADLVWPQGVREQQIVLPANAGQFHYFTLTPDSDVVTSALVVLHGYPRDVGRTLLAAKEASDGQSSALHTLIVAPLFQVPADQATHCHSPGLPVAGTDDALWRCQSWLEGDLDEQKRLSAFAALDAVLGDLKLRWPTLKKITVAGFSAGGQFVQHYIAFARPPEGIAMRYVVADPGSWLYFDPQPANACPSVNTWKYGTAALPDWLDADPATARGAYRKAEVTYLEGAQDHGKGPGRYWRILDKSCAAIQQGSSRLARGQNYARYDQKILQPVTPHLLTVVPGCAHDVRCVFPSQAGRQVLFAP